MAAYGCFDRTLKAGYHAPARMYFSNGEFEMVSQFIPFTMSTDCAYSKVTPDPRCAGCKHITTTPA